MKDLLAGFAAAILTLGCGPLLYARGGGFHGGGGNGGSDGTNGSDFASLYYFDGSEYDIELDYYQDFTLTSFSPGYLNSTLSATLTAIAPTLPANATITASVYLDDTTNPDASPLLVDNQALTLDLATPANRYATTSTSDYPTFLTGPSGTFDEIEVDLVISNLNNAAVSFSGEAEVASVPEPPGNALALLGAVLLGRVNKIRSRTTTKSCRLPR